MKISIILSMQQEIELFNEFKNNKEHIIKTHSTGIDRATSIPRFGLVPIAQLTEKVIILDNPDLVISIGTCGAKNHENIRIGDVIIANECAYFDRLLAASYQSYGFGNFPCFYQENFQTLNVKFGKISSANTFFTEKKQDDAFKKLESIGKDMESAAVADVCNYNNINCLIIRGVVSILDDDDLANTTMSNYILGIHSVKNILEKILELI